MKVLINKLLRVLFFTFFLFAVSNFNKVHANSSDRCVLESTLVVKEWMYDISYWSSGSVAAVEEDLVIKSWMVNKYYWNICPRVKQYPVILRESDPEIEERIINSAHWTM